MKFTPELIDSLAAEGLNVITAARGATSYEYDITGYRRVPRLNTPRGKFSRTWLPGTPSSNSIGPHPECASNRTYQIRLGGFERGTLYAPDAIGRTLRENNVLHSDGPGNGKYESAMIARKYGLSLSFEVRSWDLKLPITKKQLAAFQLQWTEQVRYM